MDKCVHQFVATDISSKVNNGHLTCIKIHFLIYTHGSMYEGIPDAFNKYAVLQITKPHIHTFYPEIQFSSKFFKLYHPHVLTSLPLCLSVNFL